jgi:hypothetical protein
MHTLPADLPANPEPVMLDAEALGARLGITPFQVRWLRRRKKISFVRAGSRMVRFWWPQVVADLRRFEIKAVGRTD